MKQVVKQAMFKNTVQRPILSSATVSVTWHYNIFPIKNGVPQHNTNIRGFLGCDAM